MNGRSNTVPRQMLDLCQDTLRHCLADRLELQDRIEKLEAQVKRLLDGRNGGEAS